MRKNSKYRYPGLNEIAFEKRNQEYGSYYLRRRYSRYLLISLTFGIIIFILAAVVPFLVYYFQPIDTGGLSEPPIMYYSIEPPSDEDLAEISRLIAKPPPEVQPAPVVTDSATEEKKPVEEVKPEETQEKQEVTDSVGGNGQGTSKEGTGTGNPDGLYTIIDVYPQFPGGDRARQYFIRTNIRYPLIALKSGIQGVVNLLFVIEIDGSISNVQIVKGIGGGCDEEAMRVTKAMPVWQPGKRNGRPVRVMVKMPIVFRIPGKATQ